MERVPSYDEQPPAYSAQADPAPAPATAAASGSSDPSIYTNVSAGLIGLIADAFQTIYDITDLQLIGPEEVTARRLSQAQSAVQSFKPTVQLFYKYLRHVEQGRLERPARAAMIDVDVVITLATEAMLAMSDLGMLIHSMADAPPVSSDAVVDGDDENYDPARAHVETVCALNSSLIQDLSDRIRVVEKLMTKTLAVLRVGDEPEAERYRDQIKEQVLGMLESSLTLADRTQQVQNTFGVSGLNDQDSSFVFTGITLANLDSLSLIPVAVSSSELANGRFYERVYASAFRSELDALLESKVKEKNKPLARILGLREPSSNKQSDDEKLARRGWMTWGVKKPKHIQRR